MRKRTPFQVSIFAEQTAKAMMGLQRARTACDASTFDWQLGISVSSFDRYRKVQGLRGEAPCHGSVRGGDRHYRRMSTQYRPGFRRIQPTRRAPPTILICPIAPAATPRKTPCASYAWRELLGRPRRGQARGDEAARQAGRVPQHPIRVMLVDDHGMTRHLLRELIGEAAGLAVVAEAADGESAVETARHTGPNVIVMDISSTEDERRRRHKADHGGGPGGPGDRADASR
jgi:hypothetical protein